MARTSVAANSEREVQLVEMLHESKGSLQHASDLFRQLSALFQGIQKCGGETQELAALGRYVANEWEEITDSAQLDVERLLSSPVNDVLRKAA